MKLCQWCKEENQTKNKFCSRSCSSKYARSCRNSKLSETTKQKIRESVLKHRQTTVGKKMAKDASTRMKKNNPGSNKKVQAKIKATKRMNGTLHIWPGKRGGNGQFTQPQKLLATALGWPMERASSE